MGFFDSMWFIVLSITLLLYQSIPHLPIVAAKYTLFPGDELTDTSTLISSNGIFTLGFFTLSSSSLVNSTFPQKKKKKKVNSTYLGIWYTNEVYRLWVANRDVPIRGDAILTIDVSGTVRVMNGSGATLFNVSDDKVGLGNKNNTRAILNDSGNFVVYDIVTNRTIWESFDHPTDTLIVGMKLGYDHTAKKNWELTSWADNNNPSSGAFTLKLKQYQKSPQLLIYRHRHLYWASGPWNKTTGKFQWSFDSYSTVFAGFGRFDLKYDPSGMYLIAQMIGSRPSTSPTGVWIPPADFCDEHPTPNGCVVSPVSVLSPCHRWDYSIDASVAVNEVYHWEYDYYYMGSYYYKIDDNSSIRIGDCKERCWSDCNCKACWTYNDNGTGCIYIGTYTDNGTGCIYVGTYNGINDGINDVLLSQKYIWGLQTFPKFLYPKKSRWILLSLTIVPVLVLAFVTIRIRILKAKENRRRDDIIIQLTGSSSFNYGDELERGIQDASDVNIFSLKAILAATNNFSNENKLGQGGYGPVYKGELSDGRKIAVKRLSKTSRQGILEFKSELILISKLQHTNLVRLYGCCIHQEERMLIYEFMPNKSLDFFLFDDDKKAKIDWQIRFNIIEGIAQGLLYLHMHSRMRVIHRDLKVNNVLLDENMNPKIADFGMARIFQHDMSVLMTNRVAGTYGYMAPEYVVHGTFSIKSDVFSFGVLIIEIVSGKKNSSLHSLLKCAWELWKKEATLELKDEALDDSFDVIQLPRAIHVGLLCVQENANDRPTVSQVISMLNNEIADLPHPNKPVFFRHPDQDETSRSTEHLSGNNIHVSLNGLTITTMEAR